MNGNSTVPAPAGPTTAPPLDDAGRRAPRWMLPLVVLVALLARATCFVELAGSPCIEQHRWEESDMHYFDAWGRAIAEGDWLSTRVTVPMHSWHVDVAKEHLAAHPEQRAELEKQIGAGAAGEAAERRLAEATWLRWLGGRTFYQDPLYPYLVGLTYLVCGPDPRWVFGWQMGMGIGTCLCLFLLASRWFGPAVGLAAGLLAALCPSLICYELVLVRETTIVFLGSVLVLAIVRALERSTPARWTVVGVLLALAILAKSTFVLFAFCLAIGLAIGWRRRREPIRSFVPAVIGFALVMLLPIVRNVVVGVAPLGLASSGALTFVMHNAADYDTSLGGFAVSKHAAKILGDADGRLLPSMVATLATHTFGSFVQQVAGKVGLVFHWFEIPDNTNFYVNRLYARVLWLPASSWVILALGVTGAWQAIRSARTRATKAPLWPHLVLLGTSFVSLVAFLVTSRIRLPFVAALIPFAALALVEGVRWLRVRRGAGGAIALVASLALLLFVGRPLSERVPMFRGIDLALPCELEWAPRIRAALQSGDVPGAKRALDTALQAARDTVARAGAANVQFGGVTVEGLLAFFLYDGPFEEAGARAKEASDWSKAAAIFACFGDTMPAPVRALVERRATDPSVRRQLVMQAGFYEQVYRECADAYRQAGARTEAASFSARADEIARLLQQSR